LRKPSKKGETMQTKSLRAERDYLAPDGSEIRLLLDLAARGGGLAHCVVRPGQVSVAQRHKTVGEIWYCLQGLGQVWRKSVGEEQKEQTVDVSPGRCLTIEAGEHFQTRNTGAEPLTLVIVTIPSWPGPEEAEEVEGRWRDGS
jgi:mannose-6-phosphate isomerase-like protein (cupin superfamily)